MSEHLGKISFLDTPDVNGSPVMLNGGNTPSISANTTANRPAAGTAGRLFVDTTTNALSRDTGSTWVGIGSNPGGPTGAIQYNSGGTLTGFSGLTYGTTTPGVNLRTGSDQTQLEIISAASGATISAIADAPTVYIQTDVVDSEKQGLRTYFAGPTVATSGHVILGYDGKAPFIRLNDNDNDAPYIQFDVVGSGSFNTPQFRSQFGARGPVGAATTGFSWKENGVEIASLDSTAFNGPSGTTAQRPASPVAGATRYNSDTGLIEYYTGAAWAQTTGTIAKSTSTVTITATAGGTVFSFAIPAGTLGTNRLIRISAAGSCTNSNRTFNPNFVFGGTTMWADVTVGFSGTAGWNIEMILSPNNGSTTSQNLTGKLFIGGIGASTTGNTGDAATDEISSIAIIHGTSAINTAINQTFSFNTGTFSGTYTNFVMYYYTAEII